MKQLTKEQAIKISKTKFWKDLSSEQIFRFQFFQDKLCMPFSVFHEAAEKVLNRPIYTHEFAYPDLIIREYLGDKSEPTFEEIMNLIPKNKRIIVGEIKDV